MYAATRRWFRRNRTGIAIGAGAIGLGYLAGQYVLNKIQEARQRMSEDKIAKDNLRRRFEQNQDDCTYTVLALLPTVRDEIIAALPVEQITDQLQQERQERLQRLGASEAASSEYPSAPPSTTDDASLQSSSFIHASQIVSNNREAPTSYSGPKRSKAQLWQEMKINSVTRAVALIYTVSLLTLLTRIQLNLLGRRTYLSSVVKLASPSADPQDTTISMENKDDDNYDNVYGDDFDTNRKYLTFSWWLLHRGTKQILTRVMGAVKEVFQRVNIREDVTLERIAELVSQVRNKVEGASGDVRTEQRWLEYLLPPQQKESFVIRQAATSESDDSASPTAAGLDDPMTASAVEADDVTSSLRRLLDETSDLIDSPTFSRVLTHMLDASFAHLIDFRIATEAYKMPAPARMDSILHESRVTELSDVKCKLAHVLPVFCKQAHVIAAGSGELPGMTGLPGQEAQGNEYLSVINQVHDLEAFAAVIYSSNFEYEVVESTSATTHQPEQPAAATHVSTDAGLMSTSIDSRAEINDSGAPVSLFARGETAPDDLREAGAPEDHGALEEAWQKALADEDGQQTSSST